MVLERFCSFREPFLPTPSLPPRFVVLVRVPPPPSLPAPNVRFFFTVDHASTCLNQGLKSSTTDTESTTNWTRTNLWVTASKSAIDMCCGRVVAVFRDGARGAGSGAAARHALALLRTLRRLLFVFGTGTGDTLPPSSPEFCSLCGREIILPPKVPQTNIFRTEPTPSEHGHG